MNRYCLLVATLLAGLLVWAAHAHAQAQQSPHIGYAFPAGGRQGTEFEVRVGGQYLDGVAKAHISGPGIQVKVVQLVRPMTQQQVNQLREQLKALTDRLPGRAGALVKGAVKTADISAGKQGDKPNSVPGNKPVASPEKTVPLSAEEIQTILDIRKKLAKFFNRQPNPAIAQTAVLHITTSPDAEPSVRELRLETPLGLTNPLVFQISRLPEVVTKPVEVDELPGQQPLRKLREEGRSAAGEQPTVNVQLPVV